jgi:hypothetical protein
MSIVISEEVQELIEASLKLYNIVSGENLTDEEMNKKFLELKLDKPLYRKFRDPNREVDLTDEFSDFLI